MAYTKNGLKEVENTKLERNYHYYVKAHVIKYFNLHVCQVTLKVTKN